MVRRNWLDPEEGIGRFVLRIADYFASLQHGAVRQSRGVYYHGTPCCVGAHLANYFDKAFADQTDYIRGADSLSIALGMNRAQVVLLLKQSGAGPDPFGAQTWENCPAHVFRMLSKIESAPSLVAADLAWAALTAANLQGVVMPRAKLKHANMNGIRAEGINLAHADLSYASLEGANLRGANLRGANLTFAHLHTANLKEADLRGANLQNAYIYRADLCGANMADANLSKADLRRVNLEGADVTRCNMNRTVLLYATGTLRNLDQANFTDQIRHTESEVFAGIERDREETHNA